MRSVDRSPVERKSAVLRLSPSFADLKSVTEASGQEEAAPGTGPVGRHLKRRRKPRPRAHIALILGLTMSSRKASCKRAPPCTRRVLNRELSVASSTSSYKRASFKGKDAAESCDECFLIRCLFVEEKNIFILDVRV